MRIPVSGEVEPHHLHIVAHVPVHIRPLCLLRDDSCNVPHRLVEERKPEKVVQVSTVRRAWINKEQVPKSRNNMPESTKNI